MAIEIRTTINYNYKCSICGYVYNEQRQPNQNAFFTKCHSVNCNGNYELVNQIESTYEQIVEDPIQQQVTE